MTNGRPPASSSRPTKSLMNRDSLDSIEGNTVGGREEGFISVVLLTFLIMTLLGQIKVS